MSGRILVVDDISTNRIVLKVKLATAFFDVSQASDGTEAIAMAWSSRPDLILMDVQMPGLNGIEVCQKLKSDPQTAGIPIILISAWMDRDTKLRGLKAGADDVIAKPFDEDYLLARVRSLLRNSHWSSELDRALGVEDGAHTSVISRAPDLRSDVSIVCDNTTAGNTLAKALRRITPHTIRVVARDDVLKTPADDMLILIPRVNDPNAALSFLIEIRSHPRSRASSIFLMSPHQTSTFHATALDLGVSDVMLHSASPEEVALRLQAELRRRQTGHAQISQVKEGQRLSITDHLTGLHNLRYANSFLETALKAAASARSSLAVMQLDLDRFKLVNDTHGHLAGDRVLIEVAHRLRQELRPEFLLARTGGEEFLVAVPDTDPNYARLIAENLRRKIEKRAVLLQNGTPVAVTLSIGVALSEPGADTIESLLTLADGALYAAKAQGRNAITLATTAA